MLQQESPPAWTQEAYRPPRSEYSFYCPNWGEGEYLIPGLDPDGGGVPHPRSRQWGTPSQVQTGGTPSLARYPPVQVQMEGTPSLARYPPVQVRMEGTPSLARYPPVQVQMEGTPSLNGVPPIQTWLGYPPPGPGRVPPIWTWLG